MERPEPAEDPLDADADDMIGRAVEMVVQQGTASVSLLQRRLGVGYARAGRLVDAMERMGVVSGHEGSKPRTRAGRARPTSTASCAARPPRTRSRRGRLTGRERPAPGCGPAERFARVPAPVGRTRQTAPMFEIGNTLREARLRRGLDILECEAETKIRAKYLRAMEEEQFDLMPSPTYVRGFLRTTRSSSTSTASWSSTSTSRRFGDYDATCADSDAARQPRHRHRAPPAAAAPGPVAAARHRRAAPPHRAAAALAGRSAA